MLIFMSFICSCWMFSEHGGGLHSFLFGNKLESFVYNIGTLHIFSCDVLDPVKLAKKSCNA